MTTPLLGSLQNEQRLLTATGRYRVLGFTGTRSGMSVGQVNFVQRFVVEFGIHCHELLEVPFGRHGACVGADEQFHRMCTYAGIATIAHAGHLPRYVSPLLEEATVRHPPTHTIMRNELIVDRSWATLICPSTDEEQLRSGTWATARYAEKVSRPWVQVLLNGRYQVHNASPQLMELLARVVVR